MSPRTTLAINAASAGLLGWLYGGDLLDALHARTAEVAAFSEVPGIGFASVALALTVIAAAATVLGAVQRRPSTWRGFRLMPIAAVVILFLDLFVLTEGKSPLGSAD